MTNEEKIKQSTNMVEVSGVILNDVFYEYCEIFGKNNRKFNRNIESQQEWTNSLIETYGNDMVKTRKDLFNLIPNKFHKTKMYNKLREQIN
jgi:hypothetical protein